MKKAIITLLTLLISLSAFGQIQRATLHLPNKTGEFDGTRVSYVEYLAPSKYSKRPVLLLGPGVNRGLLSNDSFIRTITERGYGFVAMHYSTLPHSINALGSQVTPFFKSNDFKMKDYAFEMEAIASWARQEFKRDIVPITLSFSGAPSSILTSFELIIDLAPMTSIRDANPSLGLYLQTLRAANFFNPFSSTVIRSAMDQSYYSVWRPKSEEMIQTFKFDNDLYDNILAGYMTSSRVLENFEWKASNTPKKTKRVLILAEQENDSLLRGQVKILKEFFSAKKEVNCFFIRGADHAISFSKPVTTANVVDLIIQNKLTMKPGCYDVKSESDLSFIDAEEFNLIFP